MRIAWVLAPYVLQLMLATVHLAGDAQTVSKCVDPAGHITYTDDACPGAKGRPPAKSAIAARTVAQSPTERELYDRAVREIEQRYPVLNVDSPSFDKTLTARVLDRKDYYVQRSFGTDYALRAAVADIMTAPVASGGILPKPEAYFQTETQAKSSRSIVDAGYEGLAKGAIYGILGLIGAGVWWLARRSKRLVQRAAYATENISTNDVARRAGAASASVERKASGALEAFKEGRRHAKARDEKTT